MEYLLHLLGIHLKHLLTQLEILGKQTLLLIQVLGSVLATAWQEVVGESIVHLLTETCHVGFIGKAETDSSYDSFEELSLKDHPGGLCELTS